MNNIIAGLDKVLESRIRLGIMSVLSVNSSADFNTMKDLMQLTDGNLASHIKALEKAGYIRSAKQFIGRRPNTTYTITHLGQKSFRTHIDALEQLLK